MKIGITKNIFSKLLLLYGRVADTDIFFYVY